MRPDSFDTSRLERHGPDRSAPQTTEIDLRRGGAATEIPRAADVPGGQPLAEHEIRQVWRSRPRRLAKEAGVLPR